MSDLGLEVSVHGWAAFVAWLVRLKRFDNCCFDNGTVLWGFLWAKSVSSTTVDDRNPA